MENNEAPAKGRVPAAEYVRMSTEHQQYSTQNQADRIRDYAARRGYEIVRTYADDGKSGLRLDGRDGLKRLLEDVRSPNPGFSFVLVYDVSRWGRFQDADESAYYEYTIRQAGIGVAYCAEAFENDGSPTATIIKSVKRAMAGEYSRELSSKVFAGQCRLIKMGFRQGGAAGFRLRRILVDINGQPKGELRVGERKSLQTDRVILAPGEPEEVELVQRVYRLFLAGDPESSIAVQLNREGHRNQFGRPWSPQAVRELLTNEKYIGSNVYNRRSFKLKKRHVENPPEMWIRNDAAFEPVVSRELFDAARALLEQRARRFTDEELLCQVKGALEKFGRLSGFLIEEQGPATSGIIASRFGGLHRAYFLVGYAARRDLRYLEINERIRELHPAVLKTTEAFIRQHGGETEHLGPGLLRVSGEIVVSVVIARCRRSDAGARRWRIKFDTSDCADINIAVRLSSDNASILDYYILPRLALQQPRLIFREFNEWSVESFRTESLECLASLCARTSIPRSC